MAIRVTVRHEKEIAAYVFTFHFSKWEFKAIKAMSKVITDNVPSSAREYDSNTHEWTILEPFWEGIKNIFVLAEWKIEELAPVVAPEDWFYQNPEAGTASSNELSKDELRIKLTAILGEDFTRKSYLRKALEWHPDRNGGDGSKMSELNSLWSAYNAS
jgi:hypothetical protein